MNHKGVATVAMDPSRSHRSVALQESVNDARAHFRYEGACDEALSCQVAGRGDASVSSNALLALGWTSRSCWAVALATAGLPGSSLSWAPKDLVSFCTGGGRGVNATDKTEKTLCRFRGVAAGWRG